MNDKPKWGISEYARMAAAIVGGVCIVAAILMTSQGKVMPIAKAPIPAGLIFLVAGLIFAHLALGRDIRAVWVGLIVSMSTLGIGLFLGYYLWGGTIIKIPAITEKYDIFRDLLILLLTVLSVVFGVVGWLLYRWISRHLQEQVKTGVQRETSAALSHLFTELSRVYTLHYEPDPTKPSGQEYKELAKDMSETALAYAEELPEKDFEQLICRAKNNLAYDLVVRRREQDGKLARELADNIYNKAHKYNDNYHWLETYGLVLIYFGKDEKEKEKGKKIIRELFSRKDIPASWIKYKQEIYKRWRLDINKTTHE